MLALPERSDLRRAGGLFVGLFVFYAVCPIKNGLDSGWTVPVAISILREGNIDLDEYRPDFAIHWHGLDLDGEHAHNFFPLGPSLLALPFIEATDLGFRLVASLGGADLHAVRRWRTHFDEVGAADLSFWDTAELVVAAFVVSLAAALIFLALRTRLTLWRALGVTLTFALGSSALSIASRALWQHGPDMLFLSAALLCLTLAQRDARWAGLAGLPTALAYVMRPTSSVSVIGLTLYVAVRHRAQLLAYLGGALVVAVPWIAENLHAFGTVLPPYYRPQRLGSPLFLEALAGNLASANRGLYVYTPVLVLAAGAFVLALRRRTLTALDGTLAAIIVAHWLVVSTFPKWWAGHSYGPRFMSDMLPYLAYLSIPLAAQLGRARPRLTGAAILLSVLGFAIHLHGATSQKPYRWNDGPPNVDDAPSRVWDFTDLQMLRR